MKLELKHIAPYLPYHLKCHCMGLHINEADSSPLKVSIVGASIDFIEIHEIGRTVTEEYHYSDVFPILRPLSDLVKNEFEDLYDSLHYHSQSLLLREDLVGNWAESMRYYDFKKLLANHFDVFGLIEKGLAIDKNSITQP